MPPRRPSKKDSPKKLAGQMKRRWRVVLLRAKGEILGEVERSVSWWVGDWWNFGQRYGDRVTVVQSENWDGPEHQACRDAGWVADRFHVSRRRDSLSFNHHADVQLSSRDAFIEPCHPPGYCPFAESPR